MLNRKHHILVAGLVIIIALLSSSFFPSDINNDKQQDAFSVYPCKSLVTGCKASVGNRNLEIRFPDNIVFLKKFPIEIRFPEKNTNLLDHVIVDFQMAGMNMGVNKYRLQQSEKNKSLWIGEGVIPVCTTGRTDWQAIVSLKRGDDVQRVAFQFEVIPETQ
ncbi:MAG: hypothetical protein P8Y24_05100 [Gammaproteobacteria bacterium]